MKILLSKKIATLILIVYAIFSNSRTNAQLYCYPSPCTCTCVANNPPGYCVTDKNGNIKCNKFHSNNGGGNDGGGACICAITHKGTGSEETSDGIYPNPVVTSTTIHVTLQETQKISLKIFDLSGKLISLLADDSFLAGEHQMGWNALNVSSGVYILRLQTPTSVQTRKLIVMK